MENKIAEILKEMDIKVGYRKLTVGVKPPFIIYYNTGSRNTNADNQVYYKTNNFNIELYNTKKDYKLEEKLENLLNTNNIIWDKGTDIYIKDEDVLLTPYYI